MKFTDLDYARFGPKISTLMGVISIGARLEHFSKSVIIRENEDSISSAAASSFFSNP